MSSDFVLKMFRMLIGTSNEESVLSDDLLTRICNAVDNSENDKEFGEEIFAECQEMKGLL